MTRRLVLSMASLLLAAGLAVSAPQAQEKKTLRCTQTDTKIEKCCCEQREGKLYCPLAKKTIEKCCCEPVKE